MNKYLKVIVLNLTIFFGLINFSYADENEVNVITKDETILLKKDKKIRIARQILKIISANINK